MTSTQPINLMKFTTIFSQYIIWWTPHFVFCLQKTIFGIQIV